MKILRHKHVIGVAITLLIAAARGAGGLILLTDYSDSNKLVAGIILAVVSMWLFIASIMFLTTRSNTSRYGLIGGVVAFWIGGIINGFLLFGCPQSSGQTINLAVAVIAVIFLYPPKNR